MKVFFLLPVALIMLSGNARGEDAKSNPSILMENLVTNGGFESDQLGWQQCRANVGSWSYDSTVFRSGAGSLKLDPSASYPPHYFAFQQRRDNVSGKYRFEVWCRVSDDCNGAPFAAVNVSVPDPAAPGKYKTAYYSLQLSKDFASGEWLKLSKDVDIPDVSILMLQIFAPGTRGTVWYDDISFTKILP